MRVSVEIPDPPPLDRLLEGISRRYEEVLSQLMNLTRQAQSKEQFQPIMQALSQQQDTLVSAFERMISAISDGRKSDQKAMRSLVKREVSAPQREASDALISAIRGVRRSLSSLPDELGDSMSKQLKRRQDALTKQEPKKKPSDNGARQVVKKLDSLENAITSGLRRSRSRTFGSNY